MDKWQIGDLALCIKQGDWRDTKTRDRVEHTLRAGAILRVEKISAAAIPGHGSMRTLGFADWPGDFFAARHFVRIPPIEQGEFEFSVTTMTAMPSTPIPA